MAAGVFCSQGRRLLLKKREGTTTPNLRPPPPQHNTHSTHLLVDEQGGQQLHGVDPDLQLRVLQQEIHHGQSVAAEQRRQNLAGAKWGRQTSKTHCKYLELRIHNMNKVSLLQTACVAPAPRNATTSPPSRNTTTRRKTRNETRHDQPMTSRANRATTTASSVQQRRHSLSAALQEKKVRTTHNGTYAKLPSPAPSAVLQL